MWRRESFEFSFFSGLPVVCQRGFRSSVDNTYTHFDCCLTNSVQRMRCLAFDLVLYLSQNWFNVHNYEWIRTNRMQQSEDNNSHDSMSCTYKYYIVMIVRLTIVSIVGLCCGCVCVCGRRLHFTTRYSCDSSQHTYSSSTQIPSVSHKDNEYDILN